MEENLYEYRHNDIDNVHTYSMIIQALPFYIMKQSLVNAYIIPMAPLWDPREDVCVSVDSQSFQHLKLPKSQPLKELNS